MLLGLETLPLRMQRHVENAATVARFLKAHEAVSWIKFPIFEDNQWTPLADNTRRKGPVPSSPSGLAGGYEAGVHFIESLEMISHVANVGDAKTLVIHPASTTHQQCRKQSDSPAEWEMTPSESRSASRPWKTYCGISRTL